MDKEIIQPKVVDGKAHHVCVTSLQATSCNFNVEEPQSSRGMNARQLFVGGYVFAILLIRLSK